MPLPNFLPDWIAPATANCTIYVKQLASNGTFNSLNNLNLTSTTHQVKGYAVAETNPQLVELIGAAPEEMAIRVWLSDPTVIPAYFQAQKVYECQVILGNITRNGLLTVVPIGHPFVPNSASLGFVLGRFKG